MYARLRYFFPPFYLAGVLLGVGVVADTDKENVAGILSHLLRIVTFLYLVDARFGIPILFQLDDECRLIDVLARYHHDVGESFPRGILTVNVIVIMCIPILMNLRFTIENSGKIKHFHPNSQNFFIVICHFCCICR